MLCYVTANAHNCVDGLQIRTSPEGGVLRTTEVRGGQNERRQQAVAEVRVLLAKLYRSFVVWGSLYEDLDLRHEQERRREEVVGLLAEFPGQYLARSMWLEPVTRKKIDRFIEKSEDLYSDFVADIVEQGYVRTRAVMAKRVSKQLGPLKKEADAALNVELAGMRQPRWRRRLRGIESSN
jgi:hypothetical protein